MSEWMSQCKHGTVSWADCSVCKTERIAELEDKYDELRRVHEENIVYAKELEAKLEITATECKGYDCCPLAHRLNEADDKVAELEKENKEANQCVCDLEGEIDKLVKALESISKNTCCDSCQEAALVAKAALGGNTDG